MMEACIERSGKTDTYSLDVPVADGAPFTGFASRKALS